VADGAILLNSTVGKNCRIGKNAYLRECILWDGVEIGNGAKLERTLLGRKAKVGDRASIEEGVVVGDSALIEKDVQIKPFIKIWPGKVIEEGSIVSRSVVWRERWSKSIFGPYGITGVCNVDITPEFAASVGAAYGSMLGKGARITSSRDSHKASRMIYRALISGVLSAGVDVSDLEMVPIPVNRFELRSLKSQGGFHVRKSPYDYEVLDIKFFDVNGGDIDSTREKKVERLFFGENFSRVSVDENGELTFPFHRVAEAYKEGVLNYLNRDILKNCGHKVVIDYAFGAASQIFPSILGELGLEVISINAHIDETKITKNKVEFDKSLDQLKHIVKSLGASLGIMLDTGGEKIFLCDERGNILDGSKTLAVMALLALKAKKNATIAVPIKESKVIDEIAKKYRGKVIRTRTSLRGMVESASAGKAEFIGESLGGFIYPDFMPSFDGMLSACKLIEELCREKSTLSDIESLVPPIKILKRDISCSPEQKGKVMRVLTDRSDGADRVELIDGIKLWYGEDWILILPDPIQPVIHIFVEATTDKNAQLLFNKYISKIDILKEE
jgi:mannose-1-phosphate guanylyltransferase/phosphomannomutase